MLLLRFRDRDPTRAFEPCDVDLDAVVAFLGGLRGIVVLVVGQKDFKVLEALSSSSLKGEIRFHPPQAPSKPLAAAFGAMRTAGPQALMSSYSQATRLKNQGLAGLAKKARGRFLERKVFLVGVVDELFKELHPDSDSPVRPPQMGEGWPLDVAEPLPPRSEAELEHYFVGRSREAVQVRKRIVRAATDPRFVGKTVLILGETGTGKELVAKAIHALGHGGTMDGYVGINCAGIPPALLEEELYGCEPIFANMRVRKLGLLELAGDGTVFLDEIGDLDRAHQAALLRALQEHRFRRVGGTKDVPLEARVIAATNRNLDAMLESREFRDDLYHRLAGIQIRTPALREHIEDIEALAQTLWAVESLGQAPPLAEPVIEMLRSHTWPGNFRELGHVLRQCLFELGEEPDATDVAGLLKRGGREASAPPTPGPAPIENGGATTADQQPDLAASVASFRLSRPLYEQWSSVLLGLLEAIATRHAPLAVVQTRTKSVASLAESTLRTSGPIWDLSGGRLVVHTEDQLKRVCRFLEQAFDVEAEASTPLVPKTRKEAYGYTPVTYVVRLDHERARTLGRDLAVDIPKDVLGLWAEVQVRTLLEHAVGNETLQGRLASPDHPINLAHMRLSKAVQELDVNLTEIRRLQRARARFPPYLTAGELRREIELLRQVLACAPDSAEVAARIGKLAITLEDWDLAVAVMEPLAGSRLPVLLRDLGVAICQKHRCAPHSKAYLRGQQYLKEGCTWGPDSDPDVWSSLGGTLRRQDNLAEALAMYQRAMDIDRTDPYAVGNVVETSVALGRSGVISTLRSPILGACERCEEQIKAGVNLPWAAYDLGKLRLLLDRPRDAFLDLAQAVELSTASHQISTSLASLDRLAANIDRPSLHEARALLALAWQSRFPEEEAAARLRELLPAPARLRTPVVIVAGTGQWAPACRVSRDLEPLVGVLGELCGTVLATNESADTGAFIAALAASHAGVSAMPCTPPTSRRASGMAPLAEAQACLKAFAGVLAAGGQAADVLVLSLGGVAEVTSAVALALGATVALIDSSATAIEVRRGPRRGVCKPVSVPADAAVLRALLAQLVERLRQPLRDGLAQRIHESYLQQHPPESLRTSPTLLPWEELAEEHRESNRRQADDIPRKLKRIGCTIELAGTRSGAIERLAPEEIERLAEDEHARWMVEHVLSGWTCGEPEDPEARNNLSLVGWEALSEPIRDSNRRAVKAIPELLAALGLRVCRAR